MNNPLTMFHEKADPRAPYSMTRVIAWLFALTYCGVLLKNVQHAHDIGWPFVALGVVTLLAVPLQALFATLVTWAMTPSGKGLIEAAIVKATSAISDGIHEKTGDKS